MTSTYVRGRLTRGLCGLLLVSVTVVDGGAATADFDDSSAPTVDSDRFTRLTSDSPAVRAYGDTFDVAVYWECGSDCNYVTDTGSGPGPCTGLTYDGTSEVCGANAFTGINVEVVESETDNGNGTHTVIVQIRSADGSDLVPNGTECAPGDVIDVIGAHLGCDIACGPGLRTACNSPSGGDDLDPNLPDPPYDLMEAKAVILGAGGSTLLEFDLATAGQTVNELGTQFTVGGASSIEITSLRFRYVIATGEFTGACCLPDDSCVNGLTGVECASLGGAYQGDFSTCPGPVCGVPANDDCDGSSTADDGVTPFDTTDATLDSSAGTPCDPDMASDLWYFYTATCTGTVTVQTCSGPDTVLQVYDGQTCPPGTTAECSDDAPGCGIGGLGSFLELPATFGQEFTIRVGGTGGPISGDLSVTCSGPPVTGGACCTGPTGCVDVSGAAQCAGLGGSYQGDGTACGVYFNVGALSTNTHFDTCSSSYNTVLEIYDVCGGTLLAHNDDCADTSAGGGADVDGSCYDPNPSSGQRDSCTCLPSTVGEDYFVKVTSFGGGAPPPGSSTSLFVTHGGACTVLPTGACCSFGSCIDDTRQGYCEGIGGTYQGDGTLCAETICPEPSGACCYSGGGCLDPVAQSDCVVGGHTWYADSTCEQVPCAPPNEACCLPNGSCQDLPASECSEAGGSALGPDSACSDDANTNGVTDGCERDCDSNGIVDQVEIAGGSAADSNANGIPDSCDIAECRSSDLNHNGIPDESDITAGTAADANTNGAIDESEQPVDMHSYVVMSDGQNFRDDDLAAALADLLINSNGTPNAKDAKLFFQECFGGGMLDDIAARLGQDIPWVAGSASRHDEVAWGLKDDPADPEAPTSLWTEALLGPLANLPVLKALKKAARDNPINPLNRGGRIVGSERAQYRFSGDAARAITLEDPAAASHHALLIAGKPNRQRHHNDVRRICETLEGEWGNLNTAETSVHLLFGDGTDNPCAGSGVPEANVLAATATNLGTVLTTLRGRLGPDEEFVLYVHDHGSADIEKGVNQAPGLRGTRAIEVELDVPFGYTFALRRDPFNPSPQLGVVATGTYPSNMIPVSLNGAEVGYLDPAAVNPRGENETLFPVPENAVHEGVNTVTVDLAAAPAATAERVRIDLVAIDILPSPGWGDADGDGDVDVEDLTALTDCMQGPEGGYAMPDCAHSDIDEDGNVDLRDGQLFQMVFTGEL